MDNFRYSTLPSAFYWTSGEYSRFIDRFVYSYTSTLSFVAYLASVCGDHGHLLAAKPIVQGQSLASPNGFGLSLHGLDQRTQCSMSTVGGVSSPILLPDFHCGKSRGEPVVSANIWTADVISPARDQPANPDKVTLRDEPSSHALFNHSLTSEAHTGGTPLLGFESSGEVGSYAMNRVMMRYGSPGKVAPVSQLGHSCGARIRFGPALRFHPSGIWEADNCC